MNNSQNLSKKIFRIFKKSSLSLFIISIACGLIYAIFLLTNIVQNMSSYENISTQKYKVMIDSQVMIDLEKLKNADEKSEYNNLPNTRLNPFAE